MTRLSSIQKVLLHASAVQKSLSALQEKDIVTSSSTNRLEECKATYQEALEVYSRLAKNNPQTYQKEVDSIKSFLESHK
jgi:hypothetical protein